MTEQMVLDLGQQAVQTAIMIVGPGLLAAVVVGVSVSIFQSITSIQDTTLTFVPKIAAVGVTMLFLGGWMLKKIINFSSYIFMNLDKFQ